MSDWGNILGKRDDPEKALTAELVAASAEPDAYRPSVIRARAQIMFSVVEADGTMHGFMYHTLRHPKHQVRNGEEFLTFTADGIAVTMQGTGLRILYLAMIRNALAEVREYDGKPLGESVSHITRLAIIDTKEQASEEQPRPRLVK